MSSQSTEWPTDDCLEAAYGDLEEPVNAKADDLEALYRASLRRALLFDPIVVAAIRLQRSYRSGAGYTEEQVTAIINAVTRAGA